MVCYLNFAIKYTISRFFNGRELRSAFDTQIKTTENETRLELSKIKENHAGEYTVRLSNAGGQAESSATLTVVQPVSKGSPPEFKQRISDQRAQQNGSIKFVCVVVSDPRPTVTWFKASFSFVCVWFMLPFICRMESLCRMTNASSWVILLKRRHWRSQMCWLKMQEFTSVVSLSKN